MGATVLIEPVGVGSRGRGGRVRAAAAIAAPMVLLVALVGVGALAGRPADRGVAEGAADGIASPAPSAALGVAATGAPAAREDAISPLFPPRVLGLPTRTVEAVLEARRTGGSDDALVAIRGYLTLWPGSATCVDGSGAATEVPGWRCERTAILRDDGRPVLGFAAGEPVWQGVRGQPHLHPTIFPGVSLGALDDVITAGDGVAEGTVSPTPVVVIGRFDDARLADRRSSARHVNEAFAIERLAWAAGRWMDHRFTRFVPWEPDDLDLRTARAVAAEALPGGMVILSQNVLAPGMLGALSGDASAAVRLLEDPPERLWFVRAMTRQAPPVDTLADSGGPRRLGWVVIGADGTILATQPDG